MNAFIVVCLAVAGLAAAEDSKYVYHGAYGDKCADDGLYYRDYDSYVMCASGHSYVQRCSPGTKMSEEKAYKYGSSYSLIDFCTKHMLVEEYKPVVNTYHAPLPVHPKPAKVEKKEVEKYDDEKEEGKYAYNGKYEAKCENDGLYFRDAYSYVVCSNGNSYVQPCAPGTRNSHFQRYAYGGYYSHSDFCDVNLVDYGYAAEKYHGYAAPLAYGYGAYRGLPYAPLPYAYGYY